MRLRKSNQEKRYNSLLTLDLSDEEQSQLAQQDHEASDEEFVVDAQQQQDDQDELDLDPRDLSDLGSQAGKKSEPKRKKNKRSWEPNAAATSLSEVQPYPTDPGAKWTRTYAGPVKRWTRLEYLIDTYWFGDEKNRREIADDFFGLWFYYELLPPKLPQESNELERARNGWMPDTFTQDSQERFSRWYQRYLSTRTVPQESTLVDKAKAFRWFLPQAEGEMSILLGHVSNQQEHHIKQGQGIPFSDSGLPLEKDGNLRLQNGGFLLDVGGIVLSMGWAPVKGQADQLLAMSVIPYSDQAFYKDLNDAPKKSELKEGTIQIWKFKAEKDPQGVARLTPSSPKLIHMLCFYWGGVERMQWCPVPLTAENHIALLAVLCGDGKLRVLEVNRNPERDNKETFEELQGSMATIQPPKEYTVEIKCFTWMNMNRIVVGLSDGSVAVWSLSPCQQLLRHPIHSSPIMDIVSGYPSKPSIVTTMPMGGTLTLTDLNRPTAEKTYHGNPLVGLQPGVLAWSDHLRGFASIWPSSFPGTSTISFVHSRVFPLSRHICTVEGQTTCLSMGACHPFLLVGSSDGSVWALNVLRKIASHRQKTHKLKVFQHEYAAPPPPSENEEEEQTHQRGTCRILHGFKPQTNFHPLGTRIAKISKIKHNKGAAKENKKKKAQKQEDKDVPEGQGETDEDNLVMMPGPIHIHEPLTRITALSWNPNAEYSWWAAAAMGSGLVRIMDLGIESDQKSHKSSEHPDPIKLDEDIEEGPDGDYNGADDMDDMEEELDDDDMM
ncbi:hypothetical protein M426DRAFT_18799 [Hypoxylon sp. CI-4A]|nr:hypothetical protein M426DRAFT_18799 [Hypoxylon sp. CI-4A]